ncbi:Type II secretion system subunit [Elusimicrobium minutum Pei191]|uniref:Type II secretion system subunit n=1 Tax=Elusimicrobium minutum (strain Pei191) TaxID=445932 RepID=B2KCA9_ELUMP|nr:prepilin-type N-terminal cleavage/methylation domain-containing protein [Elusimicrobium minutum]ACC98236.1 Type II secretion system subunit [Elusimicrobium minutum Pei191]
MSQKKGFTLIEIAVVVLVIAILAAIALPQYRKSLERSRAAEAFDILTEIRNKQESRDLLGTGTAKGYTVKFSDLGEVIAGKTSTTNTLDTKLFSYVLSDNPYPQAYAKRKDLDYSIVQTKGYQDSALCCIGKDCDMVDNVLKGCEKTACPTTCAAGYKRTGYFFSEDGPCCEAKTSCPATCPAGQKRSSVQYTEDGACCVAKTSCPTTCPTGQQRTSVQYSEDGACCVAKTSCPTTCPTGQQRTSVQYSEDGACCVSKTSCPATCPTGQKRTSVQYSEDGACCTAKTACPASCPAGEERTSVQYSEDGACCTAKTACPATCPTGQERTSVQYSEDGACCQTKTCGSGQTLVGGVCKTACPATCPTGQKRTSSQYSEDGACCVAKTACPATCPTGQERTSVQYSEDGDCCKTSSGCPVGTSIGANGKCCTPELMGIDERDGGCCVEFSNCGLTGPGGLAFPCRCARTGTGTISCSGNSTQSCGQCGTQTRTCNTSTGVWSSWSSCNESPNPLSPSDQDMCLSCGGTLTCKGCDCGTYYDFSSGSGILSYCSFNSRYGCVCGQTYRSCR